MAGNYENILKPFKLPNGQYLKNRIAYPNAQQSLVVGPENWPTEAMIDNMSEICSSGASLISFGQYDKLGGGAVPTKHTGSKWFFPSFDYSDERIFNYLGQAAYVAHMSGTKILVKLSPSFPFGYSYGGGDAYSMFPKPDDPRLKIGKGSSEPKKRKTFTPEEMEKRIAPKEMIQDAIKEVVEMAARYKKAGWDGMSFRADRYIDRSTNIRTDEYGGEIENRGRFLLELFSEVKKVCGEDFIIEPAIMGNSPYGHDCNMPEGYTEDEFVRLMNMLEPVIDIVEVRNQGGVGYQCCMWNSTLHDHPCLEYAKHLRESGFKKVIAVNGGFNDPDEMDQIIKDGVVDLISCGRTFIAEPRLIAKLQSNGKEAQTPCIFCNKCHGNPNKPNLAYCSVNPICGQAHRIPAVIKPPINLKKVAVIGGGLIGMRAACFAAQRGHSVTLFEKTDFLGGKAKYAAMYPMKWSIERYRLWLVDELTRRGVEVRINCDPEPDQLTNEGFEAVIACTGSLEKRPPIAGADLEGVITSEDIYEGRVKAEDLGQKVVFVGGGAVATETAMYLASLGKDVTVLTRQNALMLSDSRMHGPHQMVEVVVDGYGYGGHGGAWTIFDNLKPVYEVTTREIQPGKVTYTDEGHDITIDCDTVIVSGGYEPCTDEAMKYYSCTKEFYMAGDVEKESTCLWDGNIRAYGKANLL